MWRGSGSWHPAADHANVLVMLNLGDVKVGTLHSQTESDKLRQSTATIEGGV
jgi:hypothetical protein